MLEIAEITEIFPFIKSFSEESKTILAGESYARTHPKGDILLTQGSQIGGAYLVLVGELDVFTYSKQGRESILYRIGDGESCVFALNALFGNISYPAWVRVASREVKLVFIEGRVFRKLFNTEQSLRDWVWEVQSRRVINLMCSIDEILHFSIEERLSNTLVRLMDQNNEVKLTHETIAKLIGSSREVVTRSLKQLEEKSAIELGRGCITIKNSDYLRSIVTDPEI